MNMIVVLKDKEDEPLLWIDGRGRLVRMERGRPVAFCRAKDVPNRYRENGKCTGLDGSTITTFVSNSGPTLKRHDDFNGNYWWCVDEKLTSLRDIDAVRRDLSRSPERQPSARVDTSTSPARG